MTPDNPRPEPATPPRKAGLAQVVATMFWALCMIGKKGTWERDGATLTMGQVIAGALVMTVVVIGLLILLVKLAVA